MLQRIIVQRVETREISLEVLRPLGTKAVVELINNGAGELRVASQFTALGDWELVGIPAEPPVTEPETVTPARRGRKSSSKNEKRRARRGKAK